MCVGGDILDIALSYWGFFVFPVAVSAKFMQYFDSWISFQQKTSFHRSQTLDFKNGYAFFRLPREGIGGEALFANQLSQNELDDLCTKGTSLTYGQVKRPAPSPFTPAFVAYDKKVKRS